MQHELDYLNAGRTVDARQAARQLAPTTVAVLQNKRYEQAGFGADYLPKTASPPYKFAQLLASHRLDHENKSARNFLVPSVDNEPEPAWIHEASEGGGWVGRLNFRQLHVPADFVPRYRVVGPYGEFKSTVFRLSADPDVAHAISQGVYRNLTADNLTTNGTPAGQVGRLKQQADVHQAVSKVPVPANFVSTALSNLGFVVNEKYYNSDEAAYSWEEGTEAGYRVNPRSDPGYPFSVSAKRGEVVMTEVVGYRELKQVFMSDPRSYVSLLSQIGIARCKPKFETVKRSKYDTSIRNIQVMPAYIGIGMSMYAAAIMDGQSCLAGTSRGLQKFTPVRGGLNRVVETMMERARGHASQYSYAFYSDNIYYYSSRKDLWISADASKMEASFRREELPLVFQVLRALVPNWDAADRNFIEATAAVMVVDVPSVLGSEVVIVPGLPSGSPWTFLINHVRMAAYAGHLAAALDAMTNPSADDEIKAEPAVPLIVKIESVVRGLKRAYGKGKRDRDGQFVEPLPRTYALDLLGFDAVTLEPYNALLEPDSPRLSVLGGALSYKRILKTLAFRKAPKEGALSDVLAAVACLGAFCIGAWAYDDAGLIATSMFEQLREAYATFNPQELTDEEALEHLTNALGLLGGPTESLADMLFRHLLPYLKGDRQLSIEAALTLVG